MELSTIVIKHLSSWINWDITDKAKVITLIDNSERDFIAMNAPHKKKDQLSRTHLVKEIIFSLIPHIRDVYAQVDGHEDYYSAHNPLSHYAVIIDDMIADILREYKE